MQSDFDPRDKRKMTEEAPAVLDPNEARAGITPGVTRYMLGWGLGLSVVGLTVVYFLFF